ncbi:hypothetical protein CANCADRAFT_84910 [Tortispora caseinolytica NRRL Y-17796]|uniref:J domain-containing protein n=1 Tax=Tortispora caseinolytica NRRL Y-17796 TaxID=767744 RepID=A0A1E4TKP9_9ASCO|nr:hypothetical protein CANCADRAFT_84910 [Tortispora caseinolytica NRRL Y-17796]
MSDRSYSYDEQGETWPYFALTVLGAVLVPSSLSLYKALKRRRNVVVSEFDGLFSPPKEELVRLKKREIETKSRWSPITISILAAGWVLFISILFTVWSSPYAAVSVYDPYEKLGLSSSASDSQVRTAYRQLSLRYHPDKLGRLPDKEREADEARFLELTQAYKALTDETVKENLRLFGHPEGMQETKHGIALPAFLVETGSPYVVFLYILIVGLLLPSMVSSWWSNSKSYTQAGIHMTTADKLIRRIANRHFDVITEEDVFDMLSEAEEFKILLPTSSPEYVRALIDAYLNRVELDEAEHLNMLTIAARVPIILKALLTLVSSFRNYKSTIAVINVMRHFSQAVYPGDSELLQLPYVTSEDLEQSSETDPTLPPPNKRSVLDLFKPGMNLEKQKAYLAIDDDEKAKKAVKYAADIPILNIIDSYFKVPGETKVTPHSIAHIVVKFVVTPASHAYVPLEIDVNDLEYVENAEILHDPAKTNSEGTKLNLGRTPFLPTVYDPSWYCVSFNLREGLLVDDLHQVTHYESNDFSSVEPSSTKPVRVKVSTFKSMTPAPVPDKLGEFRFDVELVPTCHFGSGIIHRHVTTFNTEEESSSVYAGSQFRKVVTNPYTRSAVSYAAVTTNLCIEKPDEIPKVQEVTESDEEDNDDESDSSDVEEDGEDKSAPYNWEEINTDTEDEGELEKKKEKEEPKKEKKDEPKEELKEEEN